jgi:hypothetical protein
VTLKLHNQTTFTQNIEKLVYENNISYLEAISHYMEETKIEPEKVKKLVSPKIRDKIYHEALKLNMFKGKKSNSLPFLDDE